MSVAGGGMDGRFGGVEHDGTDDGVADEDVIACEGGESRICGGIPMPCGEIRSE